MMKVSLMKKQGDRNAPGAGRWMRPARRRAAMAFARAGCASALLLALALSAGNSNSAEKPYGMEKRIPFTTSRVIGSPEPPSPYMTELAVPDLKLDLPTDITMAPGTDRFFVPERQGRIVSFPNRPDASEADVFLDLGPGVVEPKTGRTIFRQINGLAFHPDFEKNGYFYLFLSERKPEPRRTRISRFQVHPDGPLRADPDSEFIILEFPAPSGHQGGAIKFGPDGYLYVGTGDSCGAGDCHETGQFVGDLLASILRIDVDRPHSVFPYSIPPDNPFVSTPGARGEVWAYGLRQPWRFSFDRETGDFWVGDVGQDLWEMVYLVTKGGNYGWSINEGPQPYRPERKRGPTPIIPPVAAHGHGEARSVTGGYVYRGSRLKELYGAYIYADWETGKIWGLRHDGEKVTWHEELDDTTLDIAAFAEDHEGELYMLTYNGGQIHKLVPRPKVPEDQKPPPFPRLLSETGLFSSVKEHEPMPGVIPYSVNSPLWSDHAHKERFIALPGDSQIDNRSHDRWMFPEGTVLVKTFSLEMERGNPASRRRLETRLLTLQRGSAGREQWAGYTYLWNDEQSDAVLLGRDALQKTYTTRDPEAPGGRREQTWHYPSRADCMVCHNEKANFVLGLTTAQMNREHDYGGLTDNQIRTLNHIGLFSKPLKQPPSDLPRLPDPYDPTVPVDQRARSYLHANCAHCHRVKGGGNSDFVVLYDTPVRKMQMAGVKPVHGSLGIADALLVAPGEPERSVLYRRMATLGEGRMPHISSLEIDEAAVEIISDWIKQLPAKPAE